MLFGAPLALLAAIFTSEFLTPRAKRVVKPTIELMASLPSVVLGFLAALVFAPFVEDVLPATIASLATLPACLLLAAYLWQLLPQPLSLRLEGARWLLTSIPLLCSFGLAVVLGPLAEDWLFAGDLKAWLAWQEGGPEAYASATGGWLLLTLPAGAVAVAWASHRWLTPKVRTLGHLSRARLALLELARFLAGALAAMLLALLAAKLLDSFGLDPRGGPVGTYVQRNALVVGFVMGFAIVPIIYTIADDALCAVPNHLRSASLGAGATRWQTTVRIVVPTAMSGLFSALMIGLGRAVGETMIVLMAAGNTPVMDWNVFSGFRTLSANIAVELPEAVRNSTHYRTLFLAALVLFLMTFVLNTAAELVRLRFRKRAVSL
ncbi:MAG: ABC transporter permease subunit [Planctomycetota bacterium]|nr:MAG: ABC transporter permease subunit [Planctomycetota bacterium]